MGGERTTPDPQCARINGKICDEDMFKKILESVVVSELSKTNHVSMSVLSSCMRRATETASVIKDKLKILSEEFGSRMTVDDSIDVIPYCREKQNLAGVADVLNVCSAQTMRRVRDNNARCSLQGRKR